jgi:hypothetical protein
MTEWRVNVNDGQRLLTEADGLYDVITVDAFNPFGDYAKAFFDDLEGELFELFSRGTKVTFEFSTDGGATYSTDFVGFVVNDFESEADGAEQLEVEAYTFDQFLRGDEVSSDLTGQTISSALETVIKNDVPPVDWDASLVSVEDDVELTQSYQGDKVEEFLLSVRKKSSGEIFGVQENLKFFFELPEIERTSRDIDNSQWVTHNINEEGGETKNQVLVSYADGNQSVTVDNSSDQLETQDNLGANGPAQQADSISRPEIDTLDDAIKAGEQFLEDRQSTLTGPVTTFGLTDAAPGNVVGVTVDPRGIDGDFRIAENRTQWRSETNELTVVEKKGADSDILIEQSKTLDRVENRPRDDSVTPDRVTDTKPTAEFDVSATDGTVSEDAARFVNGGRNRIRDALINETIVQTLRLEFSTDDSRPSRSDSSISNTVDTTTPTVATNAQEVVFGGATTANGIQTVGVFDDTQDTLLAVARLSDPVDSPSIDFTISLADDTDTPKTVWTNTGLNTLRDILASNAVNWPQTYAYGSDSTDPAVSDTSLANQQVTQDLDKILLGAISTQSDWESNTPSFASDVPIYIENGKLKQAQTTQFTEAENLLDFSGQKVSSGPTVGDLSDDGGVALSQDGDFVRFTFSPNYEIPSGAATADHYRNLDDFEGTVDISINGTVVTSDTTSSIQNTKNEFVGSANINQTLSPDENHEMLIELVSQNNGSVIIDTMHVFDDGSRFNGFNVSRSGSFDTNTFSYDAPELYPNVQTVRLNTFNTKREITEAEISSNWNNIQNNQFIELSNDGGTNWITTTNSETANVSFSSPGRDLEVRLGISRYDGGSTSTPTNGGFTQEVDLIDIFANPDSITVEQIGEADVRAIIRDSAATGVTFAEAGLLDTNSDLLTRSLVPEFSKTSDQKVISGERLRFQNP